MRDARSLDYSPASICFLDVVRDPLCHAPKLQLSRIVSRNHYLEGQGDLVSRSMAPTTHIVTPFIPISNLLTKSPSPPKYIELRGSEF